MLADRYTKAVLTVIAFALVSIAVENAIQPSRAFENIPKVQICDALGNCASLNNGMLAFEICGATHHCANVVQMEHTASSGEKYHVSSLSVETHPEP
jgi:hypothetical protein